MLRILKFVLMIAIGASASAETLPVPGAVVGRHIFGLAIDYKGAPLLADGKSLIYEMAAYNERLMFGEQPCLLSGFSGPVGALYLTRFASGSSNAVDTESVSLASIDGLNHPGAALKTPWNSLLISENGAVDARDDTSFVEGFKTYFKGKSEMVRPYNYGWLSEVVLLPNQNQVKVIKNYAVGRLFATQMVLMPDRRSLYLLDSTYAHRLYLFIADAPESFTKGTLYTLEIDDGQARWQQLSNVSALRAKFKLNKLEFKDIFTQRPSKDAVCEQGYNDITTMFGQECLKLNRKNAKYAGLFEPQRASALNGYRALPLEIDGLAYDEETASLRLINGERTVYTFRLGKDDKLNSSYVTGELL